MTSNFLHEVRGRGSDLFKGLLTNKLCSGTCSFGNIAGWKWVVAAAAAAAAAAKN
jgi:hypothetical protein